MDFIALSYLLTADFYMFYKKARKNLRNIKGQNMGKKRHQMTNHGEEQTQTDDQSTRRNIKGQPMNTKKRQMTNHGGDTNNNRQSINKKKHKRSKP